jgi:DNA-binding NarL/FixJ family response regulator
MRIFRRVHPEVVFMDLTLKPQISFSPSSRRSRGPEDLPGALPFLEGGEVLAKQMLYQDPMLKLVVCTGSSAESRSVREVVKYGAFSVLEKPITLAKIQQVVHLLAVEGLTISSTGPDRSSPEEAVSNANDREV